MSQIAGHAFALGESYFDSYASMAQAARENVAKAETIAAQAEQMVDNDQALVALQGQSPEIDKVVDAVRFQAHLQLLSCPENRRIQREPLDIGRPIALRLQNTALDVMGNMTGGTAGQMMAAIAKQVLGHFPLPSLAHDLYSDLETVTQPPNYWSPNDEGRLVHSGSWIAHASDKTKVAATQQMCDLLLAGASPTVETIKHLGTQVAATATSEADARSVLGNTIQAISLGHVRGDESTNIFDAEALEVSPQQKQAAATVDVGPHHVRYSHQPAWDRDVSREWLEQALGSIPNE